MEISPAQLRKSIGVYLLITLLISSVFYLILIYSGSQDGLYYLGLMWCPGISALITMRIFGRSISDLGWKWGETKYQIWSYLVPLLYALVAYLFIWISGLGKFYNEDFVAGLSSKMGWGDLPEPAVIVFYFLFLGLYGIIRGVASALGEEIGWRGFLAPTMYKLTGYTQTSLITGIIWSVWHYPILVFGSYNNGTEPWYGLTCFTVMVIGISFVFTWFRLRSGSLWTGAILHASHNLFIQAFFTPITVDTGTTKYFIDEFGAALPAVAVIAAIYFWRRRGELPAQ